MRTRRTLVLAVLPLALTLACQGKEAAPAAAASAASDAGQAAIADPTSIVGIAAGSKDHTTLVAALKAAGLVDALATPGPLTVFAPVNSAFDKLPAGTVETLLKPENLVQLRTILRHHVMVSTYKPEALTDGLKLSMLDGGPTTVTRQGSDIFIDGAKVLGSAPASNGIVYIVDAVMVPKP
jgi:uncharacterized surface protein with fasciclin (FAS1) repeats